MLEVWKRPFRDGAVLEPFKSYSGGCTSIETFSRNMPFVTLLRYPFGTSFAQCSHGWGWNETQVERRHVKFYMSYNDNIRMGIMVPCRVTWEVSPA
jgi:hypothetical protein